MMISSHNFDFLDNIPENNQEYNESLEAFISQNKRSTKSRTKTRAEEITISGKNVQSILESITNIRFTDHRNPIDYRGRYITETLANGKTRSIRNREVEFSRENYPIVSGIVDVNDHCLQYIYIGKSCVWAFLKDGKRYLFHVIDSQPYNLSMEQKIGDGKCKFGAYNGRRFHKDLIMALEMYVIKSLGNTDFLQPHDYEFVL